MIGINSQSAGICVASSKDLITSMSMGVQMPAKRKAQVILTKEDGSQMIYHTNRRDALHQMLLGVGVLSTDRYAMLHC